MSSATATDFSQTCGIRTDGSIACWGDDTFGQSVPAPGLFQQVSAGGDHACGLTMDGVVVCWGDDTSGESSPPPDRFVRVAAGMGWTCGITTGGSVECWGVPSLPSGAAPATPPVGSFVDVSIGGGSGYAYVCACGLRTGGALGCWGDCPSTPPLAGSCEVRLGADLRCAIDPLGHESCWGAAARQPL